MKDDWETNGKVTTVITGNEKHSKCYRIYYNRQ